MHFDSVSYRKHPLNMINFRICKLPTFFGLVHYKNMYLWSSDGRIYLSLIKSRSYPFLLGIIQVDCWKCLKSTLPIEKWILIQSISFEWLQLATSSPLARRASVFTTTFAYFYTKNATCLCCWITISASMAERGYWKGTSMYFYVFTLDRCSNDDDDHGILFFNSTLPFFFDGFTGFSLF